MLYRPTITEEIISQINETIKDHPDWGRSEISRRLCEIWDWRMPDGRLKDISCRDMLRALDGADKISLPAKQRSGRLPGTASCIQLRTHDTTPVETSLKALLPLKVEAIEDKSRLGEFKSYMDKYHYLGFGRTVGENMKYTVRGAGGAPLACLLFGSAAWSCKGRDEYIGWSAADRKKNLQLVTNNTRFLILPWVKVPHLASNILSLVTRRLSSDFEKKYGHPIYCLETFVERDKFKGTCYKAANFICVGKTAGRGRDDIRNEAALPVKDIYLYPLHKKYRLLLGGGGDSR